MVWPVIVGDAWTCPSCAASAASAYCPACGERRPDARELTLRGLAAQIFHALTSIDTRLVRSFVRLLVQPGELTAAYLRGVRRPYLGPVSLFLTANVLFFAAEALLGGKVFSTPLRSHLHDQPWSPWAATLVADRVAVLGTTPDLFEPKFDRAVELHARSLIILMALSFTPLPWLLFARRRQPIAAHAVFSLHLYTFLLVLLCAATAILAADSWLGGGGFNSRLWDNAMAIALLLACAVYLDFALVRVYAARGWLCATQGVLLAVGVAGIVLGYRFALFFIALYTTA
jgi:hypothetical protein